MKNVSTRSVLGAKDEVATGVHQPPANGTHLSFTGRIAGWSARHRWWVLAATVLTLIAAIVASALYEPQIQDDDLGVGESRAGAEVLDGKFPRGSDASEALLFSHPELDVEDLSYRSRVEALVEELRALPQVKSVTTFY